MSGPFTLLVGLNRVLKITNVAAVDMHLGHIHRYFIFKSLFNFGEEEYYDL